MKKHSLCLLLIILATGCAAKKIIPEITPELTAVRSAEISSSSTVSAVTEWNEKMFLFNGDGTIRSFTPENGKLETAAKLDGGIENEITVTGGMALIKKKEDGQFIIFDLSTGKIFKEAKMPEGIIPIGLDTDTIVYKDNKTLVFFNFRDMTPVHSESSDGEIFPGCEFRDDKIYITASDSIIVYDKKNRSSEKILTGTVAAGPGIPQGDFFYYGDNERNLVKFSLIKKKIVWKYKFQKRLNIKPAFKDGLIVASPQDNNLYILTQRGGLKKWFLSEMERVSPPVIMKDNIAALFRTEKGSLIRFFNLKDEKSFKLRQKDLNILFDPVHISGDLYSIGIYSEKEDPGIIRIGNRYGSIIKTAPEKNFETGRSIIFSIRPVNVFRPLIKTEILNEKGVRVFSGEIPYGKQRSVSWVPVTGGKFTFKTVTSGENGPEITDILSFSVTDIRKKYRELQMKIRSQCPEGNSDTDIQDEKKD